MKIITITIDQVAKHGSVSSAVREAANETGMLVADPSAMGGQTFATSGPGSGWTRQFDTDDYAVAAIHEDMGNADCDPSDCEVLDPEMGLVASGVDSFDAEGNWTQEIAWGTESMVELEAPTVEEAREYEKAYAQMVNALDTHADQTDLKAWEALNAELDA